MYLEEGVIGKGDGDLLLTSSLLEYLQQHIFHDLFKVPSYLIHSYICARDFHTMPEVQGRVSHRLGVKRGTQQQEL